MGAVVVIAVAQTATLWFIGRQRLAFDRVEDRVAHLTAAISLLTDTTEGALRDVLQRAEQTTTASVKSPRPSAVTARRVTGAARRGRSVQDIAATERISEGEVRLRLQLSTPMDTDASTTPGKVNGKAKEKDHAAVC